MLLFGHIGITVGLVKIGQQLIPGDDPVNSGINDKLHQSVLQSKSRNVLKNLRGIIKSIDYRFVILGSLLPDIIDKPIWMFTGSDFSWSGRGYAHTFLFSLLLFIIGSFLLVKWKKIWLFTIAVCSFIHLALDKIWLDSTVLWWPLLGPIPRGESEGWISSLWYGLTSNPYVYISELLGFLIILYLFLRLLMKKRLLHFIKTGDIQFDK